MRKARPPAHLAALAELDDAISANERTATLAAQRSLVGLNGLFVGAEASVFGAAMKGMVETHYRGAWNTWMRVALSPAVAAGEKAAALPLPTAMVAVYEAERGGEWPVLMADAQVRAWAEVRRLCKELEVPEEDTLELLRLSTGLSLQDAGYLVRQQAAVVKATEESTAPIRKKIRASVKRRAWDLLVRRAGKTAEYELAKGFNDGKRLAHAQALKTGLATEIRATWVTAKDEDVCRICSPAGGKTRVARSASTLYNRWTEKAKSVPAHINCRCTVVYEVVFSKGSWPVRRTVLLAS